jgi:FAD/FMN-containing dehydrogenase
VILTGTNLSELSGNLASAHAQGTAVHEINLQGLRQILEHNPEDLTVTTETGLSLRELQEKLSHHGQWLPLDPPGADHLTIADLISRNLSGPRRCGYGTVREHLIGLKVLLADGRLVRSGGKVVKNVAGYDLCKLFVGNQDTLGVIVEASFKLRPRPETERFMKMQPESLLQASEVWQQVSESPLTPVIFDLHSVKLSGEKDSSSPTLVLGFAGTESEVKWQEKLASSLGFSSLAQLSYEESFWTESDAEPLRFRSVLPSRIFHELAPLQEVPWLVRAANGAIHYRGGPPPLRGRLPLELLQRVKSTFDPKNILPQMSW